MHRRRFDTGLGADSAPIGVRYFPDVAVLRKRVLLIINPGSRRGMRRQAQAQSAFAHRGVTCDIVLTERPGHAAEVADERGRDYDAVFTLGGDGTVMEVIGTLAHSNVPIGVLPGGTATSLPESSAFLYALVRQLVCCSMVMRRGSISGRSVGIGLRLLPAWEWMRRWSRPPREH